MKTKTRITLCAAAAAVLALAVTFTFLFAPGIFGKTGKEKPVLKNPTASALTPVEVHSLFPSAGSTSFLSSGIAAGLGAAVRILSVAPEKPSPDGTMVNVPTDSAFVLKTEDPTDEDTLRHALTVSPASDITITKTADDTFSVSPAAGAWREDTLYRFTLGDPKNPTASCAFQTAHHFSVKRVYPADQSAGLPTDTGIEITFTDPVRNADLAGFITMTPAVEGSFSLYPDGKTAVIIPDKPLDPNTEYTVRAAAGLTADNGEQLADGTFFRFRTASVTSEEQKSELYLYAMGELLCSPDVSPVINYNAGLQYYGGRDSELSRKELKAEVWKYRSPADAVAAMKEYEAQKAECYYGGKTYEFPTAGLKKVYEGTPEIVQNNTWERGEDGAVVLPVTDEGIYLVTLTYTAAVKSENGQTTTLKQSVQSFVQITSLRAYTESCEGDTLLWINRTDTGKAAKNASVTADIFTDCGWWSAPDKDAPVYRTESGKTDADGLLSVNTAGGNAAFFTVTDGNDALIVCARLTEETDFHALRTYLYTDREVYFSDDTVHFFGVLGRSFAGQDIPAALDMRVGSQSRGTMVPVSADGTFEGSFPIEAWTAYGITVYFYDEAGDLVLSRFVRVTQEDKPVYTMSVSFDKLFYTYGERATVEVKTSFFDGTPAAGLKVGLYPSRYGTHKTVTTDDTGCASYSFTLGKVTEEYISTNAMTISVNAELMGLETTTLTGCASAKYFHSCGCFRYERISGEQSEIRLNRLDTSALKTNADFSYTKYPENTYGEPWEDTVSVTLQKTEFIRTKTGTYYDPITKTTEEQFIWNTKNTTVKTFSAKTENGVLPLEHLDASGFKGYYTYIVTWRDPVSGFRYRLNVYANRSDFYRNADSYAVNDSYEMKVTGTPAVPGDTVTCTVVYGGETVSDVPVLSTLYVGIDGRTDAVLSSSYSFVYGEEHALGAAVYGTVFANGNYVTLWSGPITYDYEKANRLDVSCSTDKESYKPGEEAVVSVSVPGGAGGVVLVSLVDEACFALGDQTVSPLDTYYSSVSGGNAGWNPILYVETEDGYGYYTSPTNCYIRTVSRDDRFSCFTQTQNFKYYSIEEACCDAAEMENGAPMAMRKADATGGMGNDVHVREVFADNPVFTAVTLDKSGCGTVSLTVPDNITTWRITAVAVKDADSEKLTDVKLGSAVSDTVCTLPFFLNVSACELYLTGDEVSLSARSAGTALTGLDKKTDVSYTAVLFREDGTPVGEQTVTARRSDAAWFNFGALEAGDYAVTVTGMLDADGETLADAVKITFTVTDTAFVMNVRRDIPAAELSSLHILGYPLSLTFHDDTYDRYLKVLDRLYYLGTDRSDAAAANFAAQCASERFSGTGAKPWYRRWFSSDDARKTLSAYGGFIPVLPHAEGDPELTARILACVPDVLTDEKKASLALLFRSLLDTGCHDEVEECAAYLGLAACGEPILEELYALAAAAGDFPTDAKLYLTAAFAACGDYAAANAAWSAVCEASGEQTTDGFCVKGENLEDTIRLTALGMMTAVHTDRTRADAMADYLLTHTSRVDLHTPELAAYVTCFLPTEVKEVSFSYRFGTMEAPETVTLRGGERFTLHLTRSDFESLTLSDADALRVCASYGGTAEEALMNRAESRSLSLEKSMEVCDEKNGIYRVTIRYSGSTDRDSDRFSLADCIPSGARFVSAAPNPNSYTSSGTSYASIYQVSGQQMAGSVCVYRPWSGNGLTGAESYSFSGAVSYLIRGAVKGSFRAEPAVAVSYNDAFYAQTDAYMLTVDGNGVCTLK